MENPKISTPREKYYYVVVSKYDGKLLLHNSNLPIYWRRSVANDVSKKFSETMVKKVLRTDLINIII